MLHRLQCDLRVAVPYLASEGAAGSDVWNIVCRY